MNARGLCLAGGALAFSLALAACPLTIEVRCETDLDCGAGEACVSGGCGPANDAGQRDSGHVTPVDSGSDAGVDAGSDSGTPPLDAGSCTTDFQCPADRRCESGACVAGLTVGDTCADTFQCPEGSHCNLQWKRCEQFCANDWACRPGYACAPDAYCIESCDEVPATLGLTCENSYDCGRCGYCAKDSVGTLRCHQKCQLERDCPDGGAGSCEDRTSYRVCRL